jgi:transposase
VEDLEKEFPDNAEVSSFTAVVIPLLSSAIKLRKQPIEDLEFYAQAARIRSEIQAVMDQPARHLGIRRIPDIFRNNKSRLYHWSEDRRIPEDNDLAERDLRPSAIARKVSFGSVSDADANTRSTLQSIVNTQKKLTLDPEQHISKALNTSERDPTADICSVLFPRSDGKKSVDVTPP